MDLVALGDAVPWVGEDQVVLAEVVVEIIQEAVLEGEAEVFQAEDLQAHGK